MGKRAASESLDAFLASELEGLKAEGLFKTERQIAGPQDSAVRLKAHDGEVLNFCANNYLGLANDPRLVGAAKRALDEHGFGMASVRFICGTQDLHIELERRIADFLGMEDCILYPSAFDANGGLFETLLGPEDAIVSDALNHASIIDGIRLSKAQRHRYPNGDMKALEQALKETRDKRFRLIATDGVFSMDGFVANLEEITALADEYDAMVMVDDCHATGFLGENGRGSPEHCGVEGKVDIVTGTLGKALGGASGGFTASSAEIVGWLRQRSRPYLFSNTLMPAIAGASIEAFRLIEEGGDLRRKLWSNTDRWRSGLANRGFSLLPGATPIVPVMIGDAALATRMADRLLEEGIYVIGFSYPVVPKGQARIRTQMSAAHTEDQLDFALNAFERVGKELGVIDD